MGFRGPGFSHSPDLLAELCRRGYRYDASTFPTFLGPIARAYYFFHSRLSVAEKDQRKQLFGSANQGFQRLRPYRWDKPIDGLIEIPVTTLPWLKVPIHMSYVMFLAEKSRGLAKTYFCNSLRWCRLWRVEPSMLLHPLDFIGGDVEPQLRFFPGLRLTTAAKTDLVHELLDWMRPRFECLTMERHAALTETRLPAS